MVILGGLFGLITGLRDPQQPLPGERTNEVRRFMMEQMALPPIGRKKLRVKAKLRLQEKKRAAAVRRREEHHNSGGSGELVLFDDGTPRCLKEKDLKSSPDELKAELQQAIQVMQAYSVAIKEDVISIKELCPITNPRARKFLKQWAAEKLFRICEDLMFSLVLVSWERWKQRVMLAKRLERMAVYMKFQSSLRLKRFFENWVKRHIAGAWMTWMQLVHEQKRQERSILELKSLKTIQRVYRGHKGRRRVDGVRKQKRAIEERKAAVKMQAFVRGCMTRKKLVEILRKKAEDAAATKIQSMARAK